MSATTARGVNGRVQAGGTSPAVDECTTYHEGRWVGSCEAAWRILGDRLLLLAFASTISAAASLPLFRIGLSRIKF